MFAKAGSIVPLRTDDLGGCGHYMWGRGRDRHTLSSSLTDTCAHTDPIGSAQVIPSPLKLMTFIGGTATRYGT